MEAKQARLLDEKGEPIIPPKPKVEGEPEGKAEAEGDSVTDSQSAE